MLLQVWLLEHLQKGQYRQKFLRRPWNDHIALRHSKKMTYIPDMFAQPKDTIGWVQFFNNLIEDQVQWMFKWFPTDEFIIMSRDVPHLVLIGLKGIYPYAPLKVMRHA